MVDTKGGQSATPEWLDNEGLGYAGHNDLFDALTDQEVGFIVLADIDYEAQLSAVHALLQRQKNTKQLLKDKIDEIDAIARTTSGLPNQQAVDEWVEHLHASVYQDAAHSMAAPPGANVDGWRVSMFAFSTLASLSQKPWTAIWLGTWSEKIPSTVA